KAQFEMYFRRRLCRCQFNFPGNRSSFRLCLQCKVDAAPARGSLLDADFFPGRHPLTQDALRKVQTVFVRILEHEHPACDEWNGLLRGNAVERGISRDAGYLSSCPATSGVTMVAMPIEKQQKLFDTIQPQ